MRTLDFVVDRQLMYKHPACDFNNLVAGSVGYLRAKFHFSKEWDECNRKVARFWIGDREVPVLLDEEGSCNIPPEVLTGKVFKVKVVGAKVEGSEAIFKIETMKVRVKQEV